MTSLRERVRRLERLRQAASIEGIRVLFLPDDLPEGCADPEAFLAERRERAGTAQLVVIEFVEPPPCP